MTLISGKTIMIAAFNSRDQCITAIERIISYLINPEYGNKILDISLADFLGKVPNV